ncbi:hypothetical protein GCM10009850_079730 [Nonomuraea monospora]|uniref:Uncharacterized protein n=1 Tax=Nonomuraea monospora TaxID=568818 RepID=A0ABN3CSU1_9ACTN
MAGVQPSFGEPVEQGGRRRADRRPRYASRTVRQRRPAHPARPARPAWINKPKTNQPMDDATEKTTQN